ncbi:MAG TPA: hypothetical protein VF941_03395 [Clostridia bacterium]
MQLKQATKTALEKINFIERYKALSNKYAFDLKEAFERYDINEVLNIIDGLRYKASYNKSENFFKIVEKTHKFKFQFNISLKYGLVELIWAIWRGKEYFDGSSWVMLKRLLDGTDENLRDPRFRNYVELKEILEIALSIYEDFKHEFLANQ